MHFRALFFFLVALFIGFVGSPTSALAATTTVCAGGCDYTSITDAVLAPPPASGDTILVDTGYVFNDAIEGGSLSLPNDLTLTCTAGVVIGNALQSAYYLNLGSTNVLSQCTYENTSFDAVWKDGCSFYRK